ncbi:MAG: O-antigen ligase family protein [Bacteroidales bacterium]
MNYLAEGQFGMKWQRFLNHRALWVFLLLYLLHFIGGLWSTDFAYWLKDVRIKLPLLVLPLVLGTSSPLPSKDIDRVLLGFVVAVLVSTLASLLALLGIVPVELDGFRDLSLFISHIRFSLMILLALLVVLEKLFLRDKRPDGLTSALFGFCLLWFPVALVLLKSLSVVFIALVLAVFYAGRFVAGIQDKVVRFMVLVPVLLLPLFALLYLSYAIDRFYSFDELPSAGELDATTRLGNPYKHYTDKLQVENGHYVWLYVCNEELDSAWRQASDLDFLGPTHNGNSVRGTLVRYLTSKNLRKDAYGVSQLTPEEIDAIERGVANYLYLKRFRLYPRIYEAIWEIDRYRSGGSPNEKSIVQRYLYLEAGWAIARTHLWFGVGSGDVSAAFDAHYAAVDSPLSLKWRRRAHNQFLTFLIALGIPGFLLCVFSLIAPLYLSGRASGFLSSGFLLIILLSMLSEDTLETAVGSVFVAFFYSLFILHPGESRKAESSNPGDGEAARS